MRGTYAWSNTSVKEKVGLSAGEKYGNIYGHFSSHRINSWRP